MDFKRLADKAKRAVDDRGGVKGLRGDAQRLRGIATGPGTAKEKAKAAREALKQQAQTAEPDAPAEAERRDPPAGGSAAGDAPAEAERHDPPAGGSSAPSA
jgi:hypothetical protein